MSFKFENLKIWNLALDLTVEINEMAKAFPVFELYSLSNQIRRAADSVVLNIAEGCTGQSNPEFSRFLGYSLRSAIEVVGCLFIARKKGYLVPEIFSGYYHQYEALCKQITALRNSLKDVK
jgi:four helix bundle protein